MAPDISPEVPRAVWIQQQLQIYPKKRVAIISHADNRFDGILDEIVETEPQSPVARLRQVSVYEVEARLTHREKYCAEMFSVLDLKIAEIKDAFVYNDPCVEINDDAAVVKCTAPIIPILWDYQIEADTFPIDCGIKPEESETVDVASQEAFLGHFVPNKNLISLVSKSKLRYEGYLNAVGAPPQSVSLTSVFMMGTEDRSENFVAEKKEIYAAVIFRLPEVRDLRVFVPMTDALRKDPILDRSRKDTKEFLGMAFKHRSKDFGYLPYSPKVLEAILANDEATKLQEENPQEMAPKTSPRKSASHSSKNSPQKLPSSSQKRTVNQPNGKVQPTSRSPRSVAPNGTTPKVRTTPYKRPRSRSPSAESIEEPVRSGAKLSAAISSQVQPRRRREVKSKHGTDADRRYSLPSPKNSAKKGMTGEASNSDVILLEVIDVDAENKMFFKSCPIPDCTDSVTRKRIQDYQSHLVTVHGPTHPGYKALIACPMCTKTGVTGFPNSLPDFRWHLHTDHGYPNPKKFPGKKKISEGGQNDEMINGAAALKRMVEMNGGEFDLDEEEAQPEEYGEEHEWMS